MNQPTTIQKAMREGYGDAAAALPVTEYGYLDNEIGFRHDQIIRDLTEIVDRAKGLLADVKSKDPTVVHGALIRIADGAGASGPIHSVYAKVIRNAATITALASGYRNGYHVQSEDAS